MSALHPSLQHFEVEEDPKASAPSASSSSTSVAKKRHSLTLKRFGAGVIATVTLLGVAAVAANSRASHAGRTPERSSASVSFLSTLDATEARMGVLPPWWIQHAIQPEGEPKDMGTWKAVQFSPEQQEVFGVDAGGQPTDQKKFQMAISAISAPMTVKSFSIYPGYTGPIHVDGNMTFTYAKREKEWRLKWELSGLDGACPDGPTDAPNSCGLHIHVGTDCSDAPAIGGHFYHHGHFPDHDPWATISWTQEKEGAAISVGVQWPGIEGHVVVVHDAEGARVACGKIEGAELKTLKLA